MTGHELSTRSEQARNTAEAEHLAAFAKAWQQGIEDAARLLAHAVTAGADWQPSHGDPLETAVFAALAAKLAAKIGALRLASMRTVAKSLRVRIRSLDAVARQNDLTEPRLREAVGGELHRLTEQAQSENLSAREASTLIQEGIVRVAPARAEMLARTEITALANLASLEAAAGTDVRFKGWISARDPAVRDPHAEADGQIVPIEAQFVVCGGQTCDAPGDPSLSDDCLCNCRCSLVYGQTLAELEGLLASAAPSTISAMATASRSARPAARRRAEGAPEADPTATVAVEPSEPEALTAAARALPFSGVAAVEGVLSDDNTYVPRVLLANSLSWPELPVPLMAQTKTAEGHDGAEIAGRIDRFSRSREKAIRFGGEFTTEFGVDQIVPMVEDKTLRFVSIDLGASEFTLVYRDGLTEVPDDAASMEEMQAGKYALGLKAGKIKAATLVPTPALGGTEIALTASADGTEARLTFPAVLAFGALADEDDQAAELDSRLSAAVGTLAHVTEMAARLDQAERRASDLTTLVETVKDEHRQQTLAQKAETLAMIESLTARIAAGEQISEAMLAAVGQLTERKPRRIEVERDEHGRPTAYLEG